MYKNNDVVNHLMIINIVYFKDVHHIYIHIIHSNQKDSNKHRSENETKCLYIVCFFTSTVN